MMFERGISPSVQYVGYQPGGCKMRGGDRAPEEIAGTRDRTVVFGLVSVSVSAVFWWISCGSCATTEDFFSREILSSSTATSRCSAYRVSTDGWLDLRTPLTAARNRSGERSARHGNPHNGHQRIAAVKEHSLGHEGHDSARRVAAHDRGRP